MTAICTAIIIVWILASVLLVWACCKNSGRLSRLEEDRDYHELDY